jgi:hypothetical protein
MSIKPLVGSHINAKKQRRFEGGYNAGKEQTVSEFAQLRSEDIDVIKKFCDFMERVFGKYFQGSSFYRSTPIGAFYRIWYDNYKSIPNERIIRLFKKVFAKYPEKWDQWTKSGGRSATQTFYTIAIQSLNKANKSVKFVTDDELIKARMEADEVEREERKKIIEIEAMVRK